MTKKPFIAHSELTNEVYIIIGKEKYCVTEQAIKAVVAIKALEQEPILDKIRAEIEQDAFKDMSGSKYIFVNRVNQIIDKYRAGSEDKE